MGRLRIRETNVLDGQPLALLILTKLISLLTDMDHSINDIALGRITCDESKKANLLQVMQSMGFKISVEEE